MTGGSTMPTRSAAHGRVNRVLLTDLITPLVLFYGLRWLGADQFLALAAGAALPLVRGVRDLAAHRRIGGVQLFVLLAMVLTVVTSLLSGSPRLLLVRGAWMTVALGLFLLGSVRARRPFLYEAGWLVFSDHQRRIWERNWELHPAFRRFLRLATALWAVAWMLDAVVLVVLATTLPVDDVPLLEGALFAVTFASCLAVQRFFGRAYLRRHGLRRDGVEIRPIATG